MLLIYLLISTPFPYSMGLTLRTIKETFFFFFVLSYKVLDLAVGIKHPTTPIDSSSFVDKVNYEHSSCMTLMIIKHGIPKAFRGVVYEEITNAK